jgi:hypothetical protein
MRLDPDPDTQNCLGPDLDSMNVDPQCGFQAF